MIPEQSEMKKESVTQHRNVVKKSTDTCVSMNSRSLISIRGKSWPWVVRHFTTLVVNLSNAPLCPSRSGDGGFGA